MAERYRQEILDEIPEVDEVLGTTAYDRILDAVDAALAGQHEVMTADLDASITGDEASCNNRRTFCISEDRRRM